MIWWPVWVAATILLAAYFSKGPNAVWGTATFALVIGIVLALFAGFDWSIVAKSTAIGAIVGFLFELLGMIGDRMKRGL